MKKYILSIVLSICVFAQTVTAQVNTNPFMKVEGMPSLEPSADTTKLAAYQLSNMSIVGARAFYNIIKGMDEFSLSATDLTAAQALKDYIKNYIRKANNTPLSITVSYDVMKAYDNYAKNYSDDEISQKEKELLLLKLETASANKFRQQAADLEKANQIRNRNSALEAKRRFY
jgi:hypothetical protein